MYSTGRWGTGTFLLGLLIESPVLGPVSYYPLLSCDYHQNALHTNIKLRVDGLE